MKIYRELKIVAIPSVVKISLSDNLLFEFSIDWKLENSLIKICCPL